MRYTNGICEYVDYQKYIEDLNEEKQKCNELYIKFTDLEVLIDEIVTKLDEVKRVEELSKLKEYIMSQRG